jgi:hypothetical protein
LLHFDIGFLFVLVLNAVDLNLKLFLLYLYDITAVWQQNIGPVTEPSV